MKKQNRNGVFVFYKSTARIVLNINIGSFYNK